MPAAVSSISVVIPSYNRAATVMRALQSVYRQSFKPIEVIVVDDGSSDNSVDLIKDCFPTVHVIQQANYGVSRARNRGIAVAKGDWIALLDSDDEWLPDRLAAQVHALEKQPEHRICHCDEIWIRNGRRVNPKKKHAKRGGWIFRDCLPLCAISPSAALIKKSLFDEIGLFDEDLPACEDYDLWLRITARYPVLYVYEKLVIKHGGHADQLSQRHWGMDRFRVQALEKILSENILDADDTDAVLKVLLEKTRVLVLGAKKRNNKTILAYYEKKYHHYSKLAQINADSLSA